MLKRFLLLLAITLLTVLVNPPSLGNEKPFEQFNHPGPPVPQSGGFTGVYIDDTTRLSDRLSRLVGVYREIPGNWNSNHLAAYGCTDIADERCAKADELLYVAVLEECKIPTETNCIESVAARMEGKDWVQGKKFSSIAESNATNFKGNPVLKVPNGGNPSTWTFEGISHESGSEFLIKAELIRGTQVQGLQPSQFVASIYAVSRRPGNYTMPSVQINPLGPNGKPWAAWSVDHGSTWGLCSTAISTTECALAWPHPEGIEYKLSVRTNVDLQGFLHGRMEDPVITVDSSSDSKMLTVQAKPLSIPILSAWRQNSQLGTELNAILENRFKDRIHGTVHYLDGTNTRAGSAITMSYDDYNKDAFEEFLLWLKETGDKSTGTKSVWTVRTLSGIESFRSGTEQCLNKYSDLTGIVTTNAAMYISAPPVFNKEDMSLDYKVSSPHLDENNKKNLGTYDLVLRSDVARCIYGFTSAPISGSVSVISVDGTAQVASTVVNERDGWLFLSAKGFSYSAPTVRVKLVQDVAKSEPVVTASPTPSPASSTSSETSAASSKVIKKSSKKSSTCVKGAKQKKLAISKAKCPAGWKKA